MPPSTKLVYYTLKQADGPLSSGEIATRTLLCPRTTRYALNKLRGADLLAKRQVITDPQRQQYVLRAIERSRDQE